MSIRDYKFLQDRHVTITDGTTGKILLNQPIDDTHFNRDTILCMIKDIIDDIVFYDSHNLNIKVGYKNT